MNQERVSVSREAFERMVKATETWHEEAYAKKLFKTIQESAQPLPSPHPETLEHEGGRYQLVEWDGTVYADALIRTLQPMVIPTNGRTAGAVVAYMEVGCAQYRPIPRPKAVEVPAEHDAGGLWTPDVEALEYAIAQTGYTGKGKLIFVPEGAEYGKEGGE